MNREYCRRHAPPFTGGTYQKHTTKTWYEDYIKLFPKETQKETCRIVCKEICKKILDEIRGHEGIEQMTKFYIGEIIEKLGVEL